MDNIVPENLVQCAFNFDALIDQPENNDTLQITSTLCQKQKYCPNCEQYFPATLDFFHTRKASRDGLNRLCKTCNSKSASAHKAKKRKERPSKPPKTHCKHGHPLVEGNLRKHNGYYECLTCHREQERVRAQSKATGTPLPRVEGYCLHGHPLVEGNLKKSNRGHRECLTCHRESAKRRYHKDPQRMVTEAAAYAKTHRDQINERQRKYRKQELYKERAKASYFRQRARQGQRDKTHRVDRQLYRDKESRVYLDMLFKDPCAYCGAPMEEIDHIVPISKGGTEHWTNLTSACRTCNSKKSNRSLLDFYLYRLEYPN